MEITLMIKKSAQRVEQEPRWVRNAALARYLNVSAMCIWRWQRDPSLNFPQGSRINNIDYTDLNLVDEWMRARVVNRAVTGKNDNGERESSSPLSA
jgi:hypothetical protein